MLSKPQRRSLLHRRSYESQAYQREDGLLDIEVEMLDTKPFSSEGYDRGYIAGGEPLHHMLMRVTIDRTMEIVDVEAKSLQTPYALCPAITDNYKRLIGLRIAAGFQKACAERLGGVQGCTHHNDMLRVVGNTAFQAMWPILQEERARLQASDPVAAEKAEAKAARMIVNSCHAYAADSPVVQDRWPQYAAKNRE